MISVSKLTDYATVVITVLAGMTAARDPEAVNSDQTPGQLPSTPPEVTIETSSRLMARRASRNTNQSGLIHAPK